MIFSGRLFPYGVTRTHLSLMLFDWSIFGTLYDVPKSLEDVYSTSCCQFSYTSCFVLNTDVPSSCTLLRRLYVRLTFPVFGPIHSFYFDDKTYYRNQHDTDFTDLL